LVPAGVLIATVRSSATNHTGNAIGIPSAAQRGQNSGVRGRDFCPRFVFGQPDHRLAPIVLGLSQRLQ